MTVTKIKLNKLDAVVVKKLKQTMQDYYEYPGNFDNEELLEIIKLQKKSVTSPIFCKALLIRWLKECDLYPFNKLCNENFWDILQTLMVVAFDQIDWVAVGQSLDGQIKKFIVALEKELT